MRRGATSLQLPTIEFTMRTIMSLDSDSNLTIQTNKTTLIVQKTEKKLEISPEDYAEAFRLANKHRWLLNGDDRSLGLQALIEECRVACHPWLPRTMLDYFKVLTSADLDEVSSLIAEQIESTCDASTTLISAVSSDTKPDGSEIVANALKGKLSHNWKKSISNTFSEALKANKSHISTYILVDDFIGSGSKIIKLIDNLSDHLKRYSLNDRKIIVAAFASMKDGENSISSKFPHVDIISGYTLSKVISEQIPPPIRSKVRDAMIEMESQIVNNWSKWSPGKPNDDQASYIFGFRQSEALIWIEGFNIPNNVFPLFWFDKRKSSDDPKKTIYRRTIFKRR